LRLRQSNARTANWQRWGPYLAERQWGTVREDYSERGESWDYFSHDHARTRLPLGRRRVAGHLRSRVPAVLCAGPVEWPRSDLEGAAVRADRPGGQPRRGRQGVLLLPRFDADPFVHEGAVQVRTSGIPLRATGG
jgi:hypothetical protein